VDLILTLFYATFLIAALCRLAVAPMPEGAMKKGLRKIVGRLLCAYVFGGLVGAVYGVAMCPDHFSMTGRFRFISVYVLFGVVLWWVGLLAMSFLRGRA